MFDRLRRFFPLLLFVLGLLYMFVITPGNVPDEGYHVDNSQVLSDSLLGDNPRYKSISASKGFAFSTYQHRDTYKQLAKLFVPSHRSDDPAVFRGGYMPTQMHLVPALGITVGRLLYFNNLQVFYTGRLFNLLLFVFCAGYAVKIIPRKYAPLLMLVCLLPMTIHSAASYSYDNAINSLCILYTALVFCHMDKPLTNKGLAGFIAVGALLAPMKFAYIFVLLLVFLIAERKKAAIIFGASMVSAFIFNLFSFKGGSPAWEVLGKEFVLEHPIKALGMFFKSAFLLLPGEIAGGVGLKIGWPFDTTETWVTLLMLPILALAAIGLGGVTFKRRAFMFACAGGVYAAFLGYMLVMWTKTDATLIGGLQGKYWPPIVLPLIAALGFNIKRLKRDMSGVLVIAAVCVNVAALVWIAAQTQSGALADYFRGLYGWN